MFINTSFFFIKFHCRYTRAFVCESWETLDAQDIMRMARERGYDTLLLCGEETSSQLYNISSYYCAYCTVGRRWDGQRTDYVIIFRHVRWGIVQRNINIILLYTHTSARAHLFMRFSNNARRRCSAVKVKYHTKKWLFKQKQTHCIIIRRTLFAVFV